ncbi:MAG TPA: RNA polymerase sigma factor [Streptosporangiaceae bacterium]|nr:RNA polymerase sigma factor [Streptosporangiaceae bacterium]
MSRDGFDLFFRQRYSRAVLLLIVMGASRADAEDAVQEAMIAAWRQWESIREPAAWLRTTATRTLWKNNRQQHAAPLEQATPQPADPDPDLMVFAEEQQRILRLLRGLPPAQRTVAALFYDGLTAAEIAVLTGKPVATVRSHLRHARNSLKEAITSDSLQPPTLDP